MTGKGDNICYMWRSLLDFTSCINIKGRVCHVHWQINSMETVSLNLNLKGSPKVVRISRADMYDPFENESKVAKYEDELFERSYRLSDVQHVTESKRFDDFSFE